MPRPTLEDLHTLEDLDGPRRLVAAMLRTAIQDARCTPGRSVSASQWKERAQKWLRNERAVCAWLDLVGLPHSVYARVLAEAGMDGKRLQQD